MMKFSLQTFYSFLYIICILVSFFPNYELTFLVWLFTLIVSVREKYSTVIFHYTAIFSIILLIAIFSTLFYSNAIFLYIKDFTYLLKPILGLFIGYQFFSNQIKNPFKFLLIWVSISFNSMVTGNIKKEI